MKRTWFRRVRAARPKSSRSPRTNRLWLELLESRNAPGSMLTGPMGSVDPSLGSAAAPATSDLAVAPADATTAQPSLPADSTLGTIGLHSSGQALPAFQTVVDPAAGQPQPQPEALTPQTNTPRATPSDPFSLPALLDLGDIKLLGTAPTSTANSLSSDASSAASAPTLALAADAPPSGSTDIQAGSWSPSPYAWQPNSTSSAPVDSFFAASAALANADAAPPPSSPDPTSSNASPAAPNTLAETRTSVASSNHPAFKGESVTFTATVRAVDSSVGVPTGTVTFNDGGTALGTVALAAGTGCAPQASFTTATLSVGDHSITAVYSGDVNFNSSTSDPITQAVLKISTSTSIVSSQNASRFGQTITFTASLGWSGPFGVPTGTISFKDGNNDLGSSPVDPFSGQGSVTTSSLTVGLHTVTAVYNGDDNYDTSTSGTLSQIVDPNTTSLALGSSLPTSIKSQQVTFTASLSWTGAGTPTGAIAFNDGGNTLATIPFDASGRAQLRTSSLSLGLHTITAVYAGDANFIGTSSSPFPQTVNMGFAALGIGEDTYGIPPGEVSFVGGFTRHPVDLTGTLTFMEGGATLGSTSVERTDVPSITIPELGDGVHIITGVYGGDSNYVSSTSQTFTHLVNIQYPPRDATYLELRSGNHATNGERVYLSVKAESQYEPKKQPPTGTVTFKEGSVVVGTGTLVPDDPNPISGEWASYASISISSLSLGAHTFTGTYGGDADFDGAISNTWTIMVNQAVTQTVLTSLPNPSTNRQAVTFSAQVSPVNTDIRPTGTVTFQDGGTSLGTVPVLSDGSASVTAPLVGVASHTIMAIYNGDSIFTGSNSNPLAQIVDPATTSTTLTSSENPSTEGDSVTFTAVVSTPAFGSGRPTGTVDFRDGGSSLGTGTLDSSGRATFTTSGLVVGMHTITAVYNGDGIFVTSTSGTLAQLVKQANDGGGQICLKVKPFIPVNADDDNGSAVTNGFPARRDFDVNPLPAADPDLLPVDVDYNRRGTGGTFTISVSHNTDPTGRVGLGEIAFWTDQMKTARISTSRSYAEADFPRRFYVEGVYASWFINDEKWTITYTYSDAGGQRHVLTDSGSVTVTPLVDQLAVSRLAVPAVRFLDAARPWRGVTAGARFDARVIAESSRGGPVFIHNKTGVDNDVGGAAAALVYQAGSGYRNQNLVLDPRIPDDSRYYPLNDSGPTGFPEYQNVGMVLETTQNPVVWTTRDIDTPDAHFDDSPRSLAIQSLNYRARFRLYVVWKYPAVPASQNRPVYYTLASVDWQATFKVIHDPAVRDPQGRQIPGLNSIIAPSDVTADDRFTIGHGAPRVTPPIANGAEVFQDV